MAQVLAEQLVTLQSIAASQGRSPAFVARAVLYWLEFYLNMSLVGNGWFDNDPDTKEQMSADNKEFGQFLRACGLINVYNETESEQEDKVARFKALMARQDVAYNEGKNAAAQGKTVEDNPHPAKSDEAMHWLYGFEGSE